MASAQQLKEKIKKLKAQVNAYKEAETNSGMSTIELARNKYYNQRQDYLNQLEMNYNSREAQIAREFNSAEAQIARDFNSQEAQISRDWQEQMSNTAHQREVHDLKMAGLNPVLSANGGAMSYTTSSANASNASANNASANVDSDINALASNGSTLYAWKTAKMNNKTNLQIAKWNKQVGLAQARANVAAAQASAGGMVSAAQLSAGAQTYGVNNNFLSNPVGYVKNQWDSTKDWLKGKWSQFENWAKNDNSKKHAKYKK